MPATNNLTLYHFLCAARRYAEHASMIQQDPRYQQRDYRLAVKRLAIAASYLTEQPRNSPETLTVLAQLIDAGQRYRTYPSVDAYAQLLAMAISWYSVEGEQSNETNNHDENLTPNS